MTCALIPGGKEQERVGLEESFAQNPIRDVSTPLDMTSKTETREVYSFSVASTLRTGPVDQADGSSVHQS